MQITHLRHNQIDKEKWDATIANAANCRIYALSWYLDIVSPGWEALVTEEYQYVMPLPVKKKFGFAYLVQPVLCQQLGIFSKNVADNQVIARFICKIPYKRYNLQFNAQNVVSSAVIRKNYILPLNLSYEQIRSSFSKNAIRNIAKSESKDLIVTNKIEYKEFRQLMSTASLHYQPHILKILDKIWTASFQHNMVEILGVYKCKTLVSACLLLSFNNRIYYLAPVSSPAGKEVAAMFSILNTFIRENAGQSVILDFEGSMIENVARFYAGFGAISEDYYLVSKETFTGSILKYCKRLLFTKV
ncbi:MAG: hypothetical protein Q8909_05765 [Bacteroidota bacterium]|nr:hypothetical protein [Bacteroidota bacterium]